MCRGNSACIVAGFFTVPIKGHGGHGATQSEAKMAAKAREAAKTRWGCMPSALSADGCTATVPLPHPSSGCSQCEGCRGDAVVVPSVLGADGCTATASLPHPSSKRSKCENRQLSIRS